MFAAEEEEEAAALTAAHICIAEAVLLAVCQLTAAVVAGAACWLQTAPWGVESIINSAFPGMAIKSAICQARCEIHDVLGQNS